MNIPKQIIKETVEQAVGEFHNSGFDNYKQFNYGTDRLIISIRSKRESIGIYIFEKDKFGDLHLEHHLEYLRETDNFTKHGEYHFLIKHLKDIIMLERLGVA